MSYVLQYDAKYKSPGHIFHTFLSGDKILLVGQQTTNDILVWALRNPKNGKTPRFHKKNKGAKWALIFLGLRCCPMSIHTRTAFIYIIRFLRTSFPLCAGVVWLQS